MPQIILNPNFDPAQQRRVLKQQIQDSLPEILSGIKTAMDKINYRLDLIDQLLLMAGFTAKEVEAARIIVNMNNRIKQEHAKVNAVKQ